MSTNETLPAPDVVDSLLHPMAGTIRGLLTRTGRIEQSRMIIDDEENIAQALAGGIELEAIFHAGEARVSAELERRLERPVARFEVAKRTCKKLFGNEKVTRIFAIARVPRPLDMTLLEPVGRDIVVLEGLSLSGNGGAIIRSSVAFAAGAIVLLNTEHIDVYDRRLIRASRGHVFSLPVVAGTTGEFLEHCKKNELSIIVTAPHAETSVSEIASCPHRLALVFGGEKTGVSTQMSSAASQRVQIPMSPHVESLNVSAAAAVILHRRFDFNGPRIG